MYLHTVTDALLGGDHTPSDNGPEPERFATPETPKTKTPKAGLVLPMKAGQEAGSGDEQLTPTAVEQPMILWESEGLTPLDDNGLGGLDDTVDEKTVDRTVGLEQVNISLKPEEPKRSPSPHTQKVVDDDTLTRRKGKADEKAAVEPAKGSQEEDAEAVKEKTVGEAAKQEAGTTEAQVVDAEPKTTEPPHAPSAQKEPASNAKPTTAARKVSPSGNKPSSADAKKPPARATGGMAGRSARPKSMADAKEPSPLRPAVPTKPTITPQRASLLKLSVSPDSSKESSPVRQHKEASPNSSGGVAAKKDTAAGRGVAAKPKPAVAPGKSPARQPVAAGLPRGRAAVKTGNGPRSDGSPSQGPSTKPKSGGSPSRGTAAKPKTSGSPHHSPNMKRKTDSPSGKLAPSRLPVERPITRARSDESNNSSAGSQAKTKESSDKDGGGSEGKLDSIAAKIDKGDGEAAKKTTEATVKSSVEGQKKRRRRISSASTGR